MTDDLQRKATRGFLWSWIGMMSTQIVSFITSIIAGRDLGSTLFGVVAAALTVLMYMEVTLDLGLGAALIYEQEGGQSRRVDVAFTVNLLLAVALELIFQIAAKPLAELFNVADVGVFRIVGLLLILRGIRQIPDALLRRDMDFFKRLWVELARNGVRLASLLLFLWMGMGVRGVVWSIVLAETVGTVLAWLLARFRPRIAFDRAIATELIRFGASVFITRFVGIFWMNGDYFVVGARRSTRDLGLYYTGFRLPELVLGSVYNIFSQVSFSTYAAANREGLEKLRRALLRATTALCLFGFMASVGLALIVRDFILLAFGEDFRGSVAPAQWICVTGALVGVGFASGDLFAAMGKPQIVAKLNLIFTPLLIIGFLLAVGHGIVAVAQVHFVMMIVVDLVKIEVTNRVVGTTWSQMARSIWPGVLGAAGVVALGLPLRLLMPEGVGTMFAIILFGGIGGVAAVWVGARWAVDEVRDMAGSALGR